MVAEPWIQKMRKKKKPSPSNLIKSSSSTIGILSFEVANAMSRAVHLHRSLSDPEISRLLTQTLVSPSIRALISDDESFLLSLAAFEKLDDLNRVATVASRLGSRHCSLPALVGFEHVYSDLLAGKINNITSVNLLYSSKDLESAVRKMERYVASTAALYAELEVLSDLEHSAKKFPDTDETRRVFDQKIQWQRHDVKQIRDSSLWNQSFDKAVILLARAICSIHARIRSVFGEFVLGVKLMGLDVSDQIVKSGEVCRLGLMSLGSDVSGQIIRTGELQRLGLKSFASDVSGQIARSGEVQKSGLIVNSSFGLHRGGLRMHCGANPGKLFLNCLSLGSSGSWNYNQEDYVETESSIIPFSGEIRSSIGVKDSKFGFGPKSRLTMLAPPSTVGGSCLALHYANTIIIIEKLLRYPHLVGEDARDDLYQMLPSSLRLSLRKSLKSHVKNLAIYDASLAHDWKEAMERILRWLAPMAHNMIRWQTEHNFEQHQIVLRESVLLLQTIYFANRVKAEAAICELLVGLNYICRFEQQQNALLDCRSSLDFDDCMD